MTKPAPGNEATINIRARPADVALIGRAADLEGKTRSSFLRDCAERAARRVFEKPRLMGHPWKIRGKILICSARPFTRRSPHDQDETQRCAGASERPVP